ncbi:MAG TPA: HAD family hydrolase [Candidatus Ozemobacteraceae bacterium]|nr:HAD family hydrolase [Candidatus Ozemobacteraceae bacterium]
MASNALRRHNAFLLFVWLVVFACSAFVPGSVLARSHLELSPDSAREVLPAALRLLAHQLRRDGSLALFDFDGTLCSEQYLAPDGRFRSGQSTWHLWGARHLQEYPRLFLQQRLGFDHDEDARLISDKDDVLEGLTDIESHGYMKFAQIACFEAGMTPGELHTGLEGFLQEYQPADYVYPVMIDFLEVLLRQGTRVWIVSGSNPHYIHAVLRQLARQRGEASETLLRHGHLIADTYSPYDPAAGTGCRLVGNMARQGRDTRFRAIYDDRFTPASGSARFIVEREGKWRAFETFIKPRDGAAIGLVAGNSDGDFELIDAAMKANSRLTALLVNPRGSHLNTLPKSRCLTIKQQSRKGGEGMTRVTGTAQNAKLGPLVLTSNGQVWVLGLEEWPPEAVGQEVEVCGTTEERSDLPVFVQPVSGPISQGIPVEPGTDLSQAAKRTCLTLANWHLRSTQPKRGAKP